MIRMHRMCNMVCAFVVCIEQKQIELTNFIKNNFIVE